MPSLSRHPSTSAKLFGFLTGPLKELVNGFETGSGVVKLPLWILGIAVTATFAPYVVIGGGLFGVLYLIRGAFQEYLQNSEEQAKLERNRKAKLQSALYHQELTSLFKQNIINEQHLQSFIHNSRLQGKNEQRIQADVQASANRLLAERFPFLRNTTNIKEYNKALLRQLLRDYFKVFDGDPVTFRKANGRYPKQLEILGLIEKVTGHKRFQSDFHRKVLRFIGNDESLKQQFLDFYPQPPVKKSLWQSIKATSLKGINFIKSQKDFRHSFKTALSIVNDFSTGSGITGGLLAAFGVFTIGNPVAWPIIAAVVASGVLFSGLGLSFNIGRDDHRRRNQRALDNEVSELETQVALTKRLVSVHKHQDKLRANAILNLGLRNNQAAENNHRYNPFQKVKPKIPLSFYFRAALGIIGRVISGSSTGVIFGMGIPWVLSMLFPALPFIMPTLLIGAAISLYYIYGAVKSEVKAISKEHATYYQLALDEQNVVTKYSSRPELRADLNKDKRVLLQEVIVEYVNYIKNNGAELSKKSNGHYLKQEKMFQLIERVSGIKRPIGDDGRLATVGDDKFYHELAYYVKGKSSDSRPANDVVQSFKDLFFKPSPHLAPAERVSADHGDVNKKKGFWQKAGTLIRDHLPYVIGAISAAVMIPVFIFSPHLLMLCALGGIILAGYALTKIPPYLSQRKAKSLENESLKISMVKHKSHFVTSRVAVRRNPVSRAAEVMPEDAKQKQRTSSNVAHGPQVLSNFSKTLAKVANPQAEKAKGAARISQQKAVDFACRLEESKFSAATSFTPNPVTIVQAN